MASIEDRSRTQISVKGKPALTKLFPYNQTSQATDYVRELKQRGLVATNSVLDEAYLIRYYVNGKRRNLTASSMEEAIEMKQRIELEQKRGSPVDPMSAHRLSLADLLIRYVKEEAPRLKGFLVVGYQINTWLQDAGLERLDMAAIHAAHPNPKTPNLHIPKNSGRRMSLPCDAAAFIRKPFIKILPADFTGFIDERLEGVLPATVDRELDVFRAVCTTAINVWRIPIAQSPFDGVKRPQYFNERDRRLVGDEEERLMAVAREEDRRRSARELVDELSAANPSDTKYQRLKALKEARGAVPSELISLPLMETYIEFALMTAVHRSEMLKLRWEHVRLDKQAAFLPETKNGRPRTLPLRSDLVALLRALPRLSEFVFPFNADYLRKAWKRICIAAGIPTTGDERLRIHDLRHEAISRVAEAGSNTPGGFTLVDLQAFSGHRDVRMLMRYAHLVPGGLAKRLDAAFADEKCSRNHHGRRRLTKEAGVSMAELVSTPLGSPFGDGSDEELPQEARGSNVVSLGSYRRIAT